MGSSLYPCHHYCAPCSWNAKVHALANVLDPLCFNLQDSTLFVRVPEIVSVNRSNSDDAKDWSCSIKTQAKEVDEHTVITTCPVSKSKCVRMVLVWDVAVKQLPVCTIGDGSKVQDDSVCTQVHVIGNETVLFAKFRLRMMSVKQFLLPSIVRLVCWFRTGMKIKAGYKMVVLVNTECDGLNFRIHNSLNDMFIASEGSIMMIEKPKGRCYGFFSIDSYELSENFASLLLNLCSCSTCCSRGFAFQFSQVDGPPMLLSQKNLGMQPKRTPKKHPRNLDSSWGQGTFISDYLPKAKVLASVVQEASFVVQEAIDFFPSTIQ